MCGDGRARGVSYASLEDARDEGITTEMAADARLQRLLDAASAQIDTATGWWFDARALTLRLDGSGAPTLHLPAPVIALTSVTLDGSALDLSTDVKVYGRTSAPRTDLGNPRLVRALGFAWETAREPAWFEGQQNVEVVGTFGYVEADGTTAPPAIREACLRLTLRSLPRLTDAAGQADRQRGEVVRENTDGHSYELAGASPGAAGAWRRGGLTGDPSIDVLLAPFRRPARGAVVGVRTPAASRFR